MAYITVAGSHVYLTESMYRQLAETVGKDKGPEWRIRATTMDAPEYHEQRKLMAQSIMQDCGYDESQLHGKWVCFDFRDGEAAANAKRLLETHCWLLGTAKCEYPRLSSVELMKEDYLREGAQKRAGTEPPNRRAAQVKPRTPVSIEYRLADPPQSLLDRLLKRTLPRTMSVPLDCESVVRVSGTLLDLVVFTDQMCIRLCTDPSVSTFLVRTDDVLGGSDAMRAAEAYLLRANECAPTAVDAALTSVAEAWARQPDVMRNLFPVRCRARVPQHPGPRGGGGLWRPSELGPRHTYTWGICCGRRFRELASSVEPANYSQLLTALADLACDPMDLSAVVGHASDCWAYPRIRPVPIRGMSLWRYDMSDHRLIYYVDRDGHNVYLLTLVDLE